MTILIEKRYRLQDGSDVCKYIGSYCDYPDEETNHLLEHLSTKSLVLGYLFVKGKKHISNYYTNLNKHLYVLLEKRQNTVQSVLLYDFKDDSHLEIAPDYVNQ